MKKSQLNAISRAYSQKRQKAIEEQAKQLNLENAFYNQETYKTLRGFITAFENKTPKFYEAIEQAKQKIEHKIKCASGKYKDQLIKKYTNYLTFLNNL